MIVNTLSNARDQLFVGSQQKRWKLPSFLLANLRSLTTKLDDLAVVRRSVRICEYERFQFIS